MKIGRCKIYRYTGETFVFYNIINIAINSYLDKPHKFQNRKY